jgi:hypothetical protein
MSENKLRRYMAAAILTVALIVPLAFYGGTGFAKSSSAAQYQYKVTICHHTGSKHHPMVTITVSNRAVLAHLARHHDTLGACPPPPAASTTMTTTAQTTTSGTGPGNSGDHGNGKSNGNGGGNGNGHGHDK